MKIKAYAKVNLSLNVVGKRDDGFHELEMLNSKVSLCDFLYIKKAKNITVKSNINICDEKNNLVYKALNLFSKKYSTEGFDVYIKKNIPIGSGLGGGSSDAASSLIMANKIYKKKLTLQELFAIACEVGSDVPYCLMNQICLVKGKGELIERSALRFNGCFVLCLNDLSISTKDVFNKYDEMSINLEKKTDYSALDAFLKTSCNVLEEPAKALYNEYNLDEIKKEFLESGALFSQMSGSGSAIFGYYGNKKHAKKAASDLSKKNKNYKFVICKAVSY